MIKWEPIETVPYGEIVTAWHKIHKLSITGIMKKRVSVHHSDGMMEKTLTTFWPVASFTHWRKPDDNPELLR